MIDLWLPPKPAIIRPHIEKASFLPGMFPAPFRAQAAPPMASFPVIEATNFGGTSGLTQPSSFDVPLPASIQAGELLLMFVSVNSSRTLTTPSGWTQRFNSTSGAFRFACYYKVAAGSEGSTVTVTASGTCAWASNSYRISNYQGTPESGTTATGANASPNPPSLSPSWGSAKTLWLACEADNAGATGAPTPPTNYGDQVTHAHVLGGVFIRVSTARRELEASNEDPGAFAIGGSSQTWLAQTVAIRPA